MSALDVADQAARAELLELLLCATQDGIVDLDLETGQTVYNSRWKHLLGFDSVELADYHETPEKWRELIHPDDREQALALIDDHVTQGWPLYGTVRMRHRHLSYKHVLLRGATQRNEQDQPTRLVLVFSDIDEHVRESSQQHAPRQLHEPRVAYQLHALQLVHDELRIVRAEVEALLASLAEVRSAVPTELLQVEQSIARVTRALPVAIERSLAGVVRASEVVRAWSEPAAAREGS